MSCQGGNIKYFNFDTSKNDNLSGQNTQSDFFATIDVANGKSVSLIIRKPKEANFLGLGLGFQSSRDKSSHQALLDFLESEKKLGFYEILSSKLGYRAFRISIKDQKIDYDDPASIEFSQKITLHHLDDNAPMVLYTSGYNLHSGLQELTGLLSANEIQIENRFHGNSNETFEGGKWIDLPIESWEHLNIKNAAYDMHGIVEKFKGFYGGTWVGTGGSKGGRQAIAHRRFFPNDVKATVAYGTPFLTGLPDSRYPGFAKATFSEHCLDYWRDFEKTMLHPDNFEDILELYTSDATLRNSSFDWAGGDIRPVLQSSIVQSQFIYLMYHNVNQCKTLGDTQNRTLVDYYVLLASLGILPSDASRNLVYDFETLHELGRPKYDVSHVSQWLDDPNVYLNYNPPEGVARPQYDGGVAMLDLLGWLEHDAEKILFIDGEFDPWRFAAFDTSLNNNILGVIVKGGNHNSSLNRLKYSADATEKTKFNAAADKLEEWTRLSVFR